MIPLVHTYLRIYDRMYEVYGSPSPPQSKKLPKPIIELLNPWYDYIEAIFLNRLFQEVVIFLELDSFWT